jgi:hypothetical protein
MHLVLTRDKRSGATCATLHRNGDVHLAEFPSTMSIHASRDMIVAAHRQHLPWYYSFNHAIPAVDVESDVRFA